MPKKRHAGKAAKMQLAIDCCRHELTAQVFNVGGRTGWELFMRPSLAITTAVLLLLGAGVAKAADSIQLAETGGFLLGNAHRCGVPTDRVEHAGKVIHDLIVTASYDSSEEAAADSRFAQIFMA